MVRRRELAGLEGVEAVALGGSRATGTSVAESDWDFAIYYRGDFVPERLLARGWEGTITEIGVWGGGVMNGGGWLTIAGRRVDVMYRDLDEVAHWCAEAEQGRFVKQFLLFYVAGIPTYVVMAELAVNLSLAGELRRTTTRRPSAWRPSAGGDSMPPPAWTTPLAPFGYAAT